MSILNTADNEKMNANKDETPFEPKPEEPIVFPETVSKEELKRLQELDMRHKRGDFRQGNY